MRNKFTQPGLKHPYHPLRKIKVAINGLRFVLLNDFSITYKFVISIITLIISLYFSQSLNFIIILIATGQVLISELFNSCIEHLCDFQKTEIDPRIKIIKDVAAAAAGISIFLWVLVLIWEYTTLFNSMF